MEDDDDSSPLSPGLPPYLPFGTIFHVPSRTDLLEHAREKVDRMRQATLEKVQSAVDLAELARDTSTTTLRRVRSQSYSHLQDAYSVAELHVQRSFTSVTTGRAFLNSIVMLVVFPLRCVAAAIWAIMSRPSESAIIAQRAADDRRRHKME